MLSKDRLIVLNKAANEARGLALDAVNKCKSGHLGLPLGCAEIGAALFGECLNINPHNTRWLNRDRFVLSAGHGSMFLYTWLHFTGFKISLEDIKMFRQKGSITSGHPEFGLTPGVECTTGPLGQGIANAVGMAVSQKMLSENFNTQVDKLFDNKIVCLCGDGCVQEGISAEACSLAGHWKLDNLIIIYDSNDVSLDSDVAKTQSDNTNKRFEAYGFEVFNVDGHDINAFCDVYNKAKTSSKRCPKIIIAKTEIGKGMDAISGTNKAHGDSGVKFLTETKKKLGLPENEFFVSDGTRKFFLERSESLIKQADAWEKHFLDLCSVNSEMKTFFDKKETDVKNFSKFVKAFEGPIATRTAFGEVLNEYAKRKENVITGSADLFSSIKNYLNYLGDFSSENYSGRNFYFGVREHAMAAICNGIAYDGFFNISCSTFLAFSDYARPAVRVAAIAGLPVKYIFSHDSVMVGEDGPTHQPVETVTSWRCIPNLDVVRPADAEECVGALILSEQNKKRPTALIFSRQDLPLLDICDVEQRRIGVLNGAYIIYKEKTKLRAIILACGSEVHLAIEVAKKHNDVRVVSMPCMERFDTQSEEYKQNILPSICQKRIAIDAGISMIWYKYVGVEGKILPIDSFGFSAKSADVMKFFGITCENLEQTIKTL